MLSGINPRVDVLAPTHAGVGKLRARDPISEGSHAFPKYREVGPPLGPIQPSSWSSRVRSKGDCSVYYLPVAQGTPTDNFPVNIPSQNQSYPRNDDVTGAFPYPQGNYQPNPSIEGKPLCLLRRNQHNSCWSFSRTGKSLRTRLRIQNFLICHERFFSADFDFSRRTRTAATSSASGCKSMIQPARRRCSGMSISKKTTSLRSREIRRLTNQRSGRPDREILSYNSCTKNGTGTQTKFSWIARHSAGE